MKSGDTVFHRPSGETWVVAWADAREVLPAGWPETIASASECDLVRSCSDDEYWAMVEAVARYQDTRGRRCFNLLETRREEECLVGWRH